VVTVVSLADNRFLLETSVAQNPMKYATPAGARRVSIVMLGGEFSGTTMVCPLNPETLEMDRKPTYVDHGIPGKAEPVSQFVHGSNLTLRFVLRLEAKSELIYMQHVGIFYKNRDGKPVDVTTRHTDTADGGDKLLRCFYFLEALCLPRRLGVDIEVGPPRFLLVWGDRMQFTCTMRSVSAKWEEFQPGTNTPIRGDVTLEAQASSSIETCEDRLGFDTSRTTKRQFYPGTDNKKGFTLWNRSKLQEKSLFPFIPDFW
jgi:hypothetical protein